MPGKLEMIVGPMRSNKTAELLRRIEIRRQYAKQCVLLLKPSADTKSAAGVVESRNPNGCGKMEAVEFPNSDPWSILPILAETEQQIGKRVECIAIDEGQFVADLFLFTKRLLQQGHDVIVSGLELDFRGMPFGEMLQLSWLVRTTPATSPNSSPTAVAERRRSIPSASSTANPQPTTSPIIMAGDFYEPRCDEHFVLPGRPH